MPCARCNFLEELVPTGLCSACDERRYEELENALDQAWARLGED